MRCPDPALHDPAAQPVAQLLFATLNARQALDQVEGEINRLIPRLREKTRAIEEESGQILPDPLYGSPMGQALENHRTVLRTQLGNLARQYISLGIEERQIKVFEEWSNLLLPLLNALLNDPDLALSRAQRRVVPDVVQRHLAQLEPPGRTDLERIAA
jgi:hypothetical protein